MGLTPEQIKLLIQQADGLAPKHGSIFVALVKLTEIEVRKKDERLLANLLRTLEYHVEQKGSTPSMLTAISAIKERLSEPLPKLPA